MLPRRPRCAIFFSMCVELGVEGRGGPLAFFGKIYNEDNELLCLWAFVINQCVRQDRKQSVVQRGC